MEFEADVLFLLLPLEAAVDGGGYREAANGDREREFGRGLALRLAIFNSRNGSLCCRIIRESFGKSKLEEENP